MTPPSQRVNSREPQPPIGVIASLVGGFEAVNKQLLLALPPLVLDLFLWLGPQLAIKPAIDAIARQVQEMTSGAAPDTLLAQSAKGWQQLSAVSDRLNLFWALSTAPLGVPSTMVLRDSEAGSFHLLGVWGIENILVLLVVLGFLVLIGFLAGAVYFECIGQQVRDGRVDVVALVRRVLVNWVSLTGLAVAAGIVAIVLGLPAMTIAMLLAMANDVLGSAALALAFSLVFWVLVFGAFAPHAVILDRKNPFAAIWESLRMVRVHLAPTTGLVATVLLLYVGLGMVWVMAPADSWVNVIGIIAHAVVSTALVAATFVYYQDRVRWWREVLAARSTRLRA